MSISHDTIREMASDSSKSLRVADDNEGGTWVGDIYIPPPITPYCLSENKGARLIITNIVIENFKSYAGKVELGPFNHCTSAIIGPNGSGKSNVIDAMLFVFGYRVQKLRLKKLSEVIHKSSKVLENDYCSVYIYFHEVVDLPNGESYSVPNSEFMISRTAHSNNMSYYCINECRKHFKEVSKLLNNYEIDLEHNRFLILQGEIESIALMKPKGTTPNECGFLEYLEDIIGTTRYIDPLAKIDKLVDHLNEQRIEKHNRCKLSEREMKDLQQPFDEAIEYLNLENQITEAKNLQFQKYLSDLKIKYAAIEEERIIVAEHVKEQHKKYAEIQIRRVAKENLIKSTMKEYDDLVKTKEVYEISHRNSNNRVAELQATLISHNKRRKQTMANILKENGKLEQFKNIPGKNKKDIDEAQVQLNKQLVKKTKQEEILAVNLSNLKEKTKDLIEEKLIMQTELVNLKKIVDEAKSNFNVAKSELELYQYQQTSETNRLKKYEEFLKKCEENKTYYYEELTEKTKVHQDLQSLYEKKLELIKQLKEMESIMNRKLNEKNAEMQARNTAQQSHTQNQIVQSLMQQKHSGSINGILGRLGDLGCIHAKYDVAISTCCGHLDSIVVENIEAGEACIRHLKLYNLGRTSFIALDKISHLNERCRIQIQTPENIPRLFDLITLEDEHIRVAFYFALYDTLVADNLEQGSRIAFGRQRYRVVTLKGVVIEAHGTMSGGGEPLRGRMGQTVPNTSIVNKYQPTIPVEQLQNELDELRDQISSNQEQQLILEKDTQSMTNELRQCAIVIKKLKLEYDDSIKQWPGLLNQYEQQIKVLTNVKIDQAHVQKLQSIVDRDKIVYEVAETNAEKLSSKVDKINSQVLEISDMTIKSVKLTIEKLDSAIHSLNSHISKLMYEVKSSERNCKQTVEKIKHLNDELKQLEEAIKRDSQIRDENIKAAENILLKIDLTKTELEKVKKLSSSFRNAIDEIQIAENEAQIKKHEMEEQLNAIDRAISEVKNKMSYWTKLLNSLKLNEILGGGIVEPLKTYTEGELERHKMHDSYQQISVLEAEISLKKPNISVIEEYDAKRKIYLERVSHLEDITVKRNEMRTLYEDVHKKRFNEFMQGFHIISKKVKEMYQAITIGGDAELELVNSMDPFSEGVLFSVRSPKKSWKQITNLSGGEKTLASLSLVFGLHYYKPSPLYIMDEIDAALDFKNVSIIANYIKERAKNAQFIIISLRSNMFELCNVLVGIYKLYDCSASIAIQNCSPEFTSATDPSVSNTHEDSNKPQTSSSILKNSKVRDTNSTETAVVDNVDKASQPSGNGSLE